MRLAARGAGGEVLRRGALLVAVVALGLPGQVKKPVYVGARICAGCHSGQGMGNQYGLWLHSKHSRTVAALARPAAREIVRRSGLGQEPQKAAICLGCHSTAPLAENWEKDDTFVPGDGVQCEACHGPGSEYAMESVMRNPEAARKAGLVMPAERECLRCHIGKGSHSAVLKTPPFDGKKALQEIAHPAPKEGARTGKLAEAPAATEFAGAAACGECHDGPPMGHQYSLWRLGPHSRGWAALTLPRSYKIAAQRKVQAEPADAPECLKCHSTAPGKLAPEEGVGCEGCHGAGRAHVERTAVKLQPVTAATCRRCHDAKFDVAAGWKKIAHPRQAAAGPAEVRYKNPLNLAFRPRSSELWVTCEAAGVVAIVDAGTRKVIAEVRAGGAPTGIAFSPGGSRAFITNRLDDTVSVFDAASRKALASLATGDEPHGVAVDAAGKLLYVLNTSSNDISVFDTAALRRVKTLSAGNGPWAAALSPDGSELLVSSSRARFSRPRLPFGSELTRIDAERGVVQDRPLVPDANLMMGIAWHPQGQFALATLNRTKTLVPMTRLLQGWTITNGLGILRRDGTLDQVLLDDADMGFADATSIAFTRDGKHALATSSGTDRVAVVSVARLLGVVAKASAEERRRVLPNHLGKAAEFVTSHVATGASPRGIAMSPDGQTAWVANSLDDSLSVIDLRTFAAAATVDLGGPKEVTVERKGQRLFHSAAITFRRQYSCHSCHPDGHVDGLTYDIEADGIGVSPVDNRTLRGILDTAPFKWEGTNPSLARQCGARLSVFFTRLLPFTPEELAAVDLYVTTVQRPPNRHRPPGAGLTAAQRRGKRVFERAATADGRTIPPEGRCVTCHPAPYFTDRLRHDVGTRQRLDRTGLFDTPHLNNIYDSAPYLHDGAAATLEEIWTLYNPMDRHGVTNDLTKDQLNDLIEYLRTL